MSLRVHAIERMGGALGSSKCISIWVYAGPVHPRDLTPVSFSIKSSVRRMAASCSSRPRPAEGARFVIWRVRTIALWDQNATASKHRILSGKARSRYAHWHSVRKRSNARNTRIDRILTKRLINNIRISRQHIGSKIRPMSKTPHLDIENEADCDLFSARPRFYINGFSRQSGDPVIRIFTGYRAS